MKPFLIGLTGSIGMGKSTTAAFFAEEGVPVWDADQAVHRIYGKGGAAVDAVRNLRPDAVKDGAIDRSALKDWIVDDPAALTQLEQVVHPIVAADRRAFIERADAPILLLDIPLLFETGADAGMDATVVVSCSPEEQRRRVLARGTVSKKQFEMILAKQMPDAEKRARADYVILTETLDSARVAVQSVLAEIRGKLANA